MLEFGPAGGRGGGGGGLYFITPVLRSEVKWAELEYFAALLQYTTKGVLK
jgi:hypothetical protein